MLKMLNRLIGENIQIIWHPVEHLWPIMIDPAQIDQILANLTVNARDAIAGTGTITIETCNMALDATSCVDHVYCLPGKYILLTVRDNGCGMDDETMTNLFEPFFTTKESGKGTGLGLATVYGIVRQNYGFINVDCEIGKGSCLTFTCLDIMGSIATMIHLRNEIKSM